MANLSPVFNDEQLDNNGDPLVGGQIIFYLAGTSTITSTFTDSTGATAHSSPIILNARGEVTGSIWLTPGQLYKARLFDSTGVLIREFDNISGINDTSSTGAAATGEWIGSLTPVYLSSTSFSVAGDQTATLAKYRRTKSIVSAGIVYGTITSATYGAGVTTIVQDNDTIALDSGLSSFQYGILSPVNKSYLPSVPSGSILAFHNATAPLGWTQITTYTNNMMRVVAGAGGGSGGSHSPILMDKVPSHTHSFTTGNQSADHGHPYTIPDAATASYGAGVLSAVPSVTTANTSGVTSDHTHSGTTNANGSASNWTPKYINVILCQKD